jgi:hypothetical protein
MGNNNEMLKLKTQSLAKRNAFGRDSDRGWQIRKEKDHGQCIIQVAKSVNKSWVSLLDDVIQSHPRPRFFQTYCISNLISTQGPSDLLGKRLVFTKLVQKRLVEKILDVPGIIKSSGRSGAFGNLLFLSRFSRIDSLQQLANKFSHFKSTAHTFENT